MRSGRHHTELRPTRPKVEELQHHTAERLERAIAIKMVVAWRIQLMLRLGRETPELPPELLFSDIELRVLATFAHSRKLAPPRQLGETVQLFARLGGWLGRTRDPRARNSCGTAMPNSPPWPSPSNCTMNTADLASITSSASTCGVRAGLAGNSVFRS